MANIQVRHHTNDCVRVGFVENGSVLVAYICGWSPPESTVRLLAFRVDAKGEFQNIAKYERTVAAVDGDWR